MTSDKLTKMNRQTLNKYYSGTKDEVELQNSLKFICNCMKQYYGQNVIILIDEYDVPLQDAYIHGYYDEMGNFLRNVFSAVLKTNDNLEKGIMTGCLRIAKESIFTGLNNFKVYSLFDYKSSEAFGFNEEEIKELLNNYHMDHYFDEVKEWHDAYMFGDKEIYNPWSTLMYVDRKLQNETLSAVSFWANTSSNSLVYDFIKRGNRQMKDDFERLVQGKSIIKTIIPELTYRDMERINNIYSFLLFTGYLKIKKQTGVKEYELIIPNKEVKEIYEQSFNQYFEKYSEDRKVELYQSLVNEEVDKANDLLNDILENSISYYDNQEGFYHGFLMGLFSNEQVESNRESRDGRFDIVILPRRITGAAIVIECKHTKSDEELIEDSEKAAKQIIDKRYLEKRRIKKYRNSIGYGISFYKKQCYMTKADKER